jgi:SAM-dependent methyltransferase
MKQLKAFLKKVKFSGSNYECPLCLFKAKQFLDGGLYKKRKNAKCPICNSLERHRQLYFILKEKANFDTSKSLLHFAPERCLKQFLEKESNLKYMTSHYGEDVTSDFHFDIRAIDAKDDTFDYIICSHVLEHIDQDILAMQEMKRVLSQGGIAFIQVPIWPSEKHPTYENFDITDEGDRIIHFGQFDHVRIYGLDVLQRLQQAGFSKVEVIDLCETLDEKAIRKYGLRNFGDSRDITYVCYK